MAGNFWQQKCAEIIVVFGLRLSRLIMLLLKDTWPLKNFVWKRKKVLRRYLCVNKIVSNYITISWFFLTSTVYNCKYKIVKYMQKHQATTIGFALSWLFPSISEPVWLWKNSISKRSVGLRKIYNRNRDDLPEIPTSSVSQEIICQTVILSFYRVLRFYEVSSLDIFLIRLRISQTIDNIFLLCSLLLFCRLIFW